MIVLSGADIVLPDRMLSPGTILIEGDRIVDVVAGERGAAGGRRYDLRDHIVVPGFVDVHVHGIEGTDCLGGGDAIRQMSRRLPRYGVTAFCPTTIACAPSTLRRMLAAVREARLAPGSGEARVLPAHLESNFINPDYRGAQPLDCLRLPHAHPAAGEFSGDDILAELAAARPDVGIVTVAPEIDGGLELVAELVSHGHHVSLGHSGSTYEEASAAIEAGARQATHLFNRMPPLGHRAPGLAGAVLESDAVVAEIICDGVHVHPALVHTAIAAKQPGGVMAITDGTAGSGLPRGSRTVLGGRTITVGDTAQLDDGTLAGSVLTMDRAFSVLVTRVGLSLVDAATVCATTPARALNLQGLGVIAPGALADFAVLDQRLQVAYTFVSGAEAWARAA